MSLSNDDGVHQALALQTTITEYLESVFTGMSSTRASGVDVNAILDHLFNIGEKELEGLGHGESACSVCMQPFVAILAEEETASAMESPAMYSGELGVVRLSQPWQCGHLFCRRDITKWVKSGKSTCPMCRQSLLDPEEAISTQGGDEAAAGGEGEASRSQVDSDVAELRHFFPGRHAHYLLVGSDSSGHSFGDLADDGRTAPPGMYS